MKIVLFFMLGLEKVSWIFCKCKDNQKNYMGVQWTLFLRLDCKICKSLTFLSTSNNSLFSKLYFYFISSLWFRKVTVFICDSISKSHHVFQSVTKISREARSMMMMIMMKEDDDAKLCKITMLIMQKDYYDDARWWMIQD